MSVIPSGSKLGTSNNYCCHIEEYKKSEGFNSFEIVHGLFVACMAKESRIRKARDCACKEDSCTKRHKRVHACLYCAFFGCYGGRHIHKHAHDRQHDLAMDINLGYVYCFVCQDYKYDAEFEMIAFRQRKIAARRRPNAAKFMYFPEPVKDRLENGFRNIRPGLDDEGNPVNLGLRGIINMGSTCYISVILQSLVHAPVIANYYLSDDHKCSFQMTLPSLKVNVLGSPEATPTCFSCEMGKIVQEFYSGRPEPYVPDRFLALIWLHCKNLAGYRMHDAHEFYLEFLNLMHQHCKGKNGQVVNSENHACCMMDKVFTGYSQTEFKCSSCMKISTKAASFTHISLETENTILEGGTPTLTDCLKKFTQTEVLSAYTCAKCNNKTEASMRVNLKNLPLIITFHLNRLSTTYFDKHITFPETIDMTPYMASEIQDDSPIPDGITQNGLDSKALNNRFYLFAVVEYTGTCESGHYVAYVRMQKKQNWYLCDDGDITSIDISEVRKQAAYLLFYHKDYMESNVNSLREEILTSTEVS